MLSNGSKSSVVFISFLAEGSSVGGFQLKSSLLWADYLGKGAFLAEDPTFLTGAFLKLVVV